MNRETRLELIRQAVRHANNILVESFSNHGIALSAEDRSRLQEATKALSSFKGRATEEEDP